MKSFLAAVVIATGLAAGAAVVLNDSFQTTAWDAFTTTGARLTDPGHNLISF